jgi:hypothetical protein
LTKKEIFWLRGNGKKFHAYTLESGVSLCGKWFMGGRAPAEDWHESDGEDAKCKECNAEISGEKVVFT